MSNESLISITFQYLNHYITSNKIITKYDKSTNDVFVEFLYTHTLHVFTATLQLHFLLF